MAFVEGRIEHARRSGGELFCPFGHKNFWELGKSENEKLREQLEAERRNRQRAEQRVAEVRDEVEHERNRVRAYKGQTTRLRNRAKAGVCPCCNRHFTALERHMATKHPEFTSDAPEPLRVIDGGKAVA